MSEKEHGENWTSKASTYLGYSESFVLILIGIALVMVAVLLLYAGVHDLFNAVSGGPGNIELKAIEILNSILLVMMTMEIVYTVAISLKSHTLNAEPFLIIGSIAAIRRMLVNGTVGLSVGPAVPEPTSLALLGTAGGALTLRRRRKA